MHFSIVIPLLALLMTASLGVLGNLVNNQTSNVTHIGLYRRETKKVTISLVYSEFAEAYEILPTYVHLPLCMDGKFTDGPMISRTFLQELQTAEGGRIHAGQWVQQVSSPNSFLKAGCYKFTDHPRNINGVKLKAFTSVLTTNFEKGTKLFLPDLEGVEVDNGAHHNGCVEVVDNSGGGDYLKLYVFGPGRKQGDIGNLQGKKVEVEVRESCEIKKYKLKKK